MRVRKIVVMIAVCILAVLALVSCGRISSGVGSSGGVTHTASVRWITENGVHYHPCVDGCGERYNEARCSFLNATCSVPSVCSVCGSKNGDALGHDLVDHEGKLPSCTEPGYNAYQACARCTYTTFSEIPAGHMYSAWSLVTAATCTSDGAEQSVCSVCGKTETRVIPALGHALVLHEAKAVTCTEDGWDAYQKCSRCDFSTYSGISATGHDLGDWFRAGIGSCTELIEEQRLCKKCNYYESREGSTYNHTLEDGLCVLCGYDEQYQQYTPSEGLEFSPVEWNFDTQRYEVKFISIGSCTDTVIVIPSSYNGAVVVGIGGTYAFYDNDSITGVVIPRTVTYMEMGPFDKCDSLTSIVFMDPEGWYVGGTAVPTSELSDPATAAACAVGKYSDSTWEKE